MKEFSLTEDQVKSIVRWCKYHPNLRGVDKNMYKVCLRKPKYPKIDDAIIK